MDLEAQHLFEQFTLGILTIDELEAVEIETWDEKIFTISTERSVEIASGFAASSLAVDLLPSLNQHHIFNKKVISQALSPAIAIVDEIQQLRSGN